MSSLTFIKHCKSEFNFLKNPIDSSSRIASHIKIRDFGYLTPLTSHLTQNNSFIKSIILCDSKDFENDTKIIFLIYDNADNLLGQVGICIDENSLKKFRIKFENFSLYSEFLNSNDISNLFKELIKWTRSVLFPEEIVLKIESESKILFESITEIGFIKNLDADSNQATMILAIDKNIGNEMILTAGPSIGSREKVFALDAATNGWNNQWSKYLNEFEKKFAEYVGVRYAILVMK